MSKMFDESSSNQYDVPGDPNLYCIGSITRPGLPPSERQRVVLTMLAKIGNNSASSVAANLLRSFPNIQDVMMVGIAGGVPDPANAARHVRVGDIVVSLNSGVIQYDMIKLSRGGLEIRDTSQPPSARLIQFAKLLEANRLQGIRPWEKYIAQTCPTIENSRRPSEELDVLMSDEVPAQRVGHPQDPDRIPGQPRVHYGNIASANTLLKDPGKRDQLRRDFNVLAVEMEGSGIADGTWIAGAQYVLIRGVCDYCDSYKNDVWQNYAAVAAAAYCRALIEALPKFDPSVG